VLSVAAAMIEAAVLENPKPDYILGLHVSSEIEVGKLDFRSGVFIAFDDDFFLKLLVKVVMLLLITK
jgi:hypothetical protein